MASRVTVELLDDIDGKKAAETLVFGIDGQEFEIDLSEKNAKALRNAFESYASAGRRVSGRLTRSNARPIATGVDNKAVRAWASSNGIELSSRGRIPAEVIDKYRAAGN
ncbi:Lsr2 family protein [Kineosporia sp. NBRC 101731]|uniref:histone-like nucleoid-structuring protein Lsr2 n=1 Tax=Kineosporia sp. NBRC 101731 TaxID=3032199 RepID=UPI0024A1ABDE|nr:Lsr2 family protein [Kineosporia sp. NBRC 101731]GLY33399.1 Lsr2 family protein [Kineosporia sp. NBRC 101731]